MSKRLTVIYEVPDDYHVIRITGTGETEVVRCESMDVMLELGKLTARLAAAEREHLTDALVIEQLHRELAAAEAEVKQLKHNEGNFRRLIRNMRRADEAAKAGGCDDQPTR